ncbi:MAG: tRNA 2-selenouridine(34) synthase MnmH [Spirulinaceae cyanobacterium]
MRSPTYTQTPWQETYSEIIDVRSEGEFREDHFPGAINLPVLNNCEREKVGTIYKQNSPFAARKIGAALVTQNMSGYLSDYFANQGKDYHPLIYCWRGGQRSYSMAIILSQIGWRTTIIEGGYKTYRAYVREQLSQLPQKFTYKVLCGLTGTGKTHILQNFAHEGRQVLDLEAIANHRGSLLGEAWLGQPQSQPSQKRFESLLLEKLQQFDLQKPVWVESESNKIGKCHLPPALWQMMKRGSCVEVQLPLEARIDGLLQEYPHLIANPNFLKDKLKMLTSRYGKAKITQWCNLIDQGKWRELVGDLLTHHYDPSYQRSLNKTYSSLNIEHLSFII